MTECFVLNRNYILDHSVHYRMQKTISVNVRCRSKVSDWTKSPLVIYYTSRMRRMLSVTSVALFLKDALC